MGFNILALLVQVTVAVLLVATIIYAYMLNRKLTNLRQDQAQFEQLIRQFTGALGMADSGVHNLRMAAEEAGNGLQKYVDRAQILRDELAYMLESGDALAEQLAGQIRDSRLILRDKQDDNRSAELASDLIAAAAAKSKGLVVKPTAAASSAQDAGMTKAERLASEIIAEMDRKGGQASANKLPLTAAASTPQSATPSNSAPNPSLPAEEAGAPNRERSILSALKGLR